MKEFIEFIAKHLVDNPEAVRVEEIIEEENKIKFNQFISLFIYNYFFLLQFEIVHHICRNFHFLH